MIITIPHHKEMIITINRHENGMLVIHVYPESSRGYFPMFDQTSIKTHIETNVETHYRLTYYDGIISFEINQGYYTLFLQKPQIPKRLKAFIFAKTSGRFASRE